MAPYLSLRKAASQIGVHHTTLARAVRRGLLTPSTATPGGQARFSSQAVAAYAGALRAEVLSTGEPSAEASAFQQAALLLTAELHPDAVLQRLADEAQRLTHARYAAVGMMDEHGRILQFFTSGITEAQRAAIGALPQGHGLLGMLFQQGAPIRVPDVSKHPQSSGFPPNHPPMRSLLGVPIVSHGRNVGNIYLADKAGAAEFSAKDQRLIEDLAQYAAVAIRNAQLYQQATFHAQQWQILTNIFRTVTSSLEPQTVLKLVVKEARRLLRVDAAFIALLDAKTQELRITAWSGLRTKQLRGLRFSRDRGLGGAALLRRSPIVVEDYGTDEELRAPLREEIAGEGLMSQIAMPLEARGNQLGVLYAGQRSRRAFSSSEIDLVTQLAGVAALALDNAHLFRAEQAAHAVASQVEARLEAVLEHLPEAVFVVDLQQRVVLANGAAAGILLGDEDRHLEGRRYPFGATYFYPDGKPMADEDRPVMRCLNGRGPCLGIEMVIQRSNGTRLPLLVSSAPIPNRQGTIGGVVVVQQDISRLKEIEQMKDDFLSMITHDLKSPLTTIKGMASSMLLSPEPSTVTIPLRWAQAIDAEADRLTELVNNLLDMSRIEARAMPLEMEECYLVELIGESLERLRHTAGFSTHPIRVEVSAELPPVFADYSQVQRVMLNLFANAAKYSADDAEIVVLARRSAGEHALEIAVQDRGIGIPIDERQQIFEKFYRSPHQLGGRRQGSGLGLAICRAIVEAHGGRIWVESQPGRGSTFFFTIPLADPELLEQ